MRIALLGGTFDPPHRAHLQILEHLAASSSYDEVWVIPSPQNPLKGTQTRFSHRLKMCYLAFDKIHKKVKVLDVEKNLSGFTIDLVRHLRKIHPNIEITFFAGSDLMDQMDQWKESEELKKLIDIEFLPRPPDPKSPFLPIRSRDIRARINSREDIQQWVPDAVADYIETHRLYLKEKS